MFLTLARKKYRRTIRKKLRTSFGIDVHTARRENKLWLARANWHRTPKDVIQSESTSDTDKAHAYASMLAPCPSFDPFLHVADDEMPTLFLDSYADLPPWDSIPPRLKRWILELLVLSCDTAEKHIGAECMRVARDCYNDWIILILSQLHTSDLWCKQLVSRYKIQETPFIDETDTRLGYTPFRTFLASKVHSDWKREIDAQMRQVVNDEQKRPHPLLYRDSALWWYMHTIRIAHKQCENNPYDVNLLASQLNFVCDLNDVQHAELSDQDLWLTRRLKEAKKHKTIKRFYAKIATESTK